MSRVPLTPFDRMFLAGHTALARRGLPGHPCLAWLDLDRPLDVARLRSGLREALDAAPVLCARIDCSRLTGRAHWQLNGQSSWSADAVARLPLEIVHAPAADPDGAASGAIAAQATHEAVGSADADGDGRERAALLASLRSAQDPRGTPQIRLYAFVQEGDRQTVVLRWPHYAMDLEGAQMFLRIVGGQPMPAAERAASPLVYPREWSRHYIRRWLAGLWQRWTMCRRRSCRFVERAAAEVAIADYVVRRWSPDETGRMLAAARRVCSPGPLQHTRHFLIGVLRALEDLRAPLGLGPGDCYVVPLPFRRPRREPRERISVNDLTIATLAVERALLHDPAAVDASLMAQIAAHESGGGEAAWMLMSYAGLLRMRHYERLMERGLFPPYSIGFASFRAEGWEGGFCGARVANTLACGHPPIPPGVMLTFTRYRERLNLGVAFYPHVCSREHVKRLVRRTEEYLAGAA